MARESESQLQARQVIERALGRRLRLYEDEPGGDDSIDYIDERNEAYEMKDVTSEEFTKMRKRRRLCFPSAKLTMHWSIVLDAPTMDDKFRPMPDFPDDDAESTATLEAEGFKVTRKTEREAAWREQYSGMKFPVPRIGEREAHVLEDQLLVLERAGITNTREANPTTAEQIGALAQIRRLTHGAICVAHEPFDDGSGIEVTIGWGYVRSGDPDVLAFRIQSWLDDAHQGSNLRDSLRQSKFTRRHGVLTFDSSEPEYTSAQEVGHAFVPTTGLTLPPEVDVLWCLIGRVLLRYENSHGWQSFETV